MYLRRTEIAGPVPAQVFAAQYYVICVLIHGNPPEIRSAMFRCSKNLHKLIPTFTQPAR